MKRIGLIGLIGFILLAASVSAQTITVGSANGNQGDSVAVSVNFTNDAANIVLVNFDILYNTALVEYVSATRGSAIPADWSFNANMVEAGKIRVLTYKNVAPPPVVANGEIVVLNMKIKGTFGICQLTIENVMLSDTQGNSVTASALNAGAIKIGPVYSLTLNVDPANSGTASASPADGTDPYLQSTVVHITAAAAAGYTFSHWTGEVADANSASTTVTMDKAQTVTAYFTLNVTYELTLNVDPANSGTALANPADGTSPYPENKVVNITATPEAGYAFSHWTGEVADANAASTTVTMDKAKTVTAYFIQGAAYALTLAVDPQNSGTILANPQSGLYAENSVVNLTASPMLGYSFSHWSGEVADVNAQSTTVTMNKAKTVTAYFVQITFNLDVDNNGEISALTDGFLILSYLFGFSGNILTGNGEYLAQNAQSTDPALIKTYLDSGLSLLDIDGNGKAKPLTDGLLILRQMFGFSGTALTKDLIGQDATRTDPAIIAAYIQQMK